MLKANTRPTPNSKVEAKPKAKTEARKEAKGKLKDASSIPKVKSSVHPLASLIRIILRAVALSREKSQRSRTPHLQALEVVAYKRKIRCLDSSLVRSNANHWLNASAQNLAPVPELGDFQASAILIATGQCSEVERPDRDAHEKALIAVTENINQLQELVREKSAKISANYAERCC